MNHTKPDLEKIGVNEWDSIADSFEDANLFLGNGFSIGLCPRLSYRSLFAKFIQSLDKSLEKIFKSFGTTNFELIIQILNSAESVNKILDYPFDKIEPLRKNLREGLIKTIQENHPKHSEIYYPQLINLSKELEGFRDIFTTNYDVFLYKTILQSITDHRYLHQNTDDPYQDFFYEEMSGTELGFVNDKFYPTSRSIYYLHGALFLYQTANRTTNYKLRKLESIKLEYIQVVRREIENDNFPIFVAEGDFRDKLRTINNNSYLNFCATQLQKSYRNIVFYGFSFGDSDRHIVDFLNKSKVEKIAISIYKGDKPLGQLEKEVSYFRNQFTIKDVAVFDSEGLFPSLRPC